MTKRYLQCSKVELRQIVAMLSAFTGKRLAQKYIEVVQDGPAHQYGVRYSGPTADFEMIVNLSQWRQGLDIDACINDVESVEFASWPPTRHGGAQ